MIYTIGGLKGGTGKTTIAVNLAIWLSTHRNVTRVLLVDADPGKSAYNFTKKRQELSKQDAGYDVITAYDQELKKEVVNLTSSYSHIIIDIPAGDSESHRAALLVTDYYLIPFEDSDLDRWLLSELRPILKEALPHKLNKLHAIAFLGGSQEKILNFLTAIQTLGDSEIIAPIGFPLQKRVTYYEAFRSGLSIFEMVTIDEKACAEFNALMFAINPQLELLQNEIEQNDNSEDAEIAILPSSSGDLQNFKHLNIKLTQEEVNQIRQLRLTLPKTSRSARKRLSVSMHDWVVLAVQEKIKRDLFKTTSHLNR